MLETSMVRIAGVSRESVVDGTGLRSTIFFQGCHHACQDCHNPETWDPGGGTEVSLSKLLSMLKLNPLIDGITFSGGEPFLQSPALVELAAHLKALGLNLWIYSGFTWEYLNSQSAQPSYKELLAFADVLVDGPFLMNVKEPGLSFRGSANQRIIKVQDSLAASRIILWTPETIQIK
jgi:anaerobic ribonucleoside-triphosphate reductase activating protein